MNEELQKRKPKGDFLEGKPNEELQKRKYEVDFWQWATWFGFGGFVIYLLTITL